MKLTPWFPPDVKPVRVGWYHTGCDSDNPINSGGESAYNWWWDGHGWHDYPNGYPSRDQNRYWRGLSENPEKS